ncbi:MAG: response regulator transcription factor [Hungatella sp.]|nr:response regulator transcription factor [Hungatella sp.]
MVKIGICDDEQVMCEELKTKVSSILSICKEEYKITCCTNAVKLLFTPLDFDIIFLDIQMPDLNGMELARRLREKGFGGVLIFVTVLKECMPGAFEVEAADYLIKPIDEKRLERTLKRSMKRLETKTEKHLIIQTMNWCRTVKLRDIYYCEVMNRKIFLHTRNGIMEYYGKIKDVEQQTAPFFIRCHRSYLINPDYLSQYGDGQVMLDNGERIPVSKNYRQALMKRMMEYMEEEP